MSTDPRRTVSTARLVLVPALLTLALTLLRLTGDFLRSFEVAPVEIAWLVPLFGAYFAMCLAKSNEPAPGAGHLLRNTLLALAFFVGGLLLLRPTSGGMGLVSILAIVLIERAWPRLGSVLLGYALAARLPVILAMLAAGLGGWRTAQNAAPYNLVTGLLPQLTIWVAFTVVVGSLAGSVALALRRHLRDEAKPFGGSTATS